MAASILRRARGLAARALGVQGSRSVGALVERLRAHDPDASRDGTRVSTLGLLLDPETDAWMLDAVPMIADLARERGFRFERTEDSLVARRTGAEFELRSALEVGVVHDVYGRDVYRLILDRAPSFVDVGANVGVASVYLANELEAEVVGFELVPALAERARAHIQASSAGARIEAVGLGPIGETIGVPFSAAHAASTSLHGRMVDGPTETVRCEIVPVGETLGPIIESAKGPIWIKLDCEGSEYGILQAMADASLLKRVDGFLMEYHEIDGGFGRAWIERFLSESGFAVHGRSRPGYDHEMLAAFRR